MTIFITSDSHFHHKNILDFEARPFKTVDEMNAGLIETWNSVVRKTDTVYHLGDFCFGSVKEWLDILNQLRGNIILIKGNHDKSKITKKVLNDGYITEYHPLGTVMKIEGMMLNLSHYPMLIGSRPNNFSIHGHLHSLDSGHINHVNVGVDSTFAKSLGKPFGTPIELNGLVKHLQEINSLVEAEKLKERSNWGGKMLIKIKGKGHAAFSEFEEEITVDLNKDNLSIDHNEYFTIVNVNRSISLFEKDSLVLELA